MSWIVRFGVVLALMAAIASSARADITFKLKIEGKHEVFDSCVYNFEIDTHGADFSLVDFFFDVYVNGEPHLECTTTFRKLGKRFCKGIPGGTQRRVGFLCEELTKIKAVGAVCYDANKNEVDCGEPALEGPDILTFD